MKRKITLTALLTAAVLALPMGCQKEGVAGGSGSRTGNTDGFTASILQKGETDLYSKCGVENLCPATDTKTYLTGDDKVAWSTDDKILVKGATEQTMTVVPFGTDATTAMLSGTAPEPATSGRKYTGFYPATSGWWDTSTKLVTLPAVRTYNAKSPLDCVPMYAEGDTKHLEFKPMFGLFEFTLTGDKRVNSIKIIAGSATPAKKNISGKFGMDATGKAVCKNTGVIDSAVVKFDGGIVPGPGLKTYIALPEGTYDSLTVVIRTDATDTWGGVYSKVLKPADGIVITSGEVYSTTLNTSNWEGIQMWVGGCYWADRNLGATCGTTLDSWYGNYYSYGAARLQYDQAIFGPDLSGASGNVNNAFRMCDVAPEFGKYPLWVGPSIGFGNSYRNTPYCNTQSPTLASHWNKYNVAGDELDMSDDAAHVSLGGTWRIPSGGSDGEFIKLVKACGGDVTTFPAGSTIYAGSTSYDPGFVTVANLHGVLFKSMDVVCAGMSLFFPFSGYGGNTSSGLMLSDPGIGGWYNSRTLSESDFKNVDVLKIKSTTEFNVHHTSPRYFGQSLRPVCDL